MEHFFSGGLAVSVDEYNAANKFCEDDVLNLDCYQRIGLGIFLSFQLEK